MTRIVFTNEFLDFQGIKENNICSYIFRNVSQLLSLLTAHLGRWYIPILQMKKMRPSGYAFLCPQQFKLYTLRTIYTKSGGSLS